MFWQKKNLRTEEYEILIKRIITLEAENDRFRNLIENLRSSVSSLRGIVNRKLGGKDFVEEPSPSGINDGFDELRNLNKGQAA